MHLFWGVYIDTSTCRIMFSNQSKVIVVIEEMWLINLANIYHGISHADN